MCASLFVFVLFFLFVQYQFLQMTYFKMLFIAENPFIHHFPPNSGQIGQSQSFVTFLRFFHPLKSWSLTTHHSNDGALLSVSCCYVAHRHANPGQKRRHDVPYLHPQLFAHCKRSRTGGCEKLKIISELTFCPSNCGLHAFFFLASRSVSSFRPFSTTSSCGLASLDNYIVPSRVPEQTDTGCVCNRAMHFSAEYFATLKGS